MRVFVVGATGWIGSAIVDELHRTGHDVVGLVRSQDAAQTLRDAGSASVVGDIADTHVLQTAAQEADAIVYAASAPVSATHAALSTLVSAFGGTNKPLVYISGSSRYGETGEGDPADEPAFIRRLQSDALRGTPEHAVYTSVAQGVRGIIVVGAGILYGHGGGATPAFWLNDARKRNAAWYIGDGQQRWSAGHVDDLASLVGLAIADQTAYGVYNAVAESVPLREAAEAVAQATKIEGGATSVSQAEASNAWGDFWANALARNLWLSSEWAEKTLDWHPVAPRFREDLLHGSYQR